MLLPRKRRRGRLGASLVADLTAFAADSATVNGTTINAATTACQTAAGFGMTPAFGQAHGIETSHGVTSISAEAWSPPGFMKSDGSAVNGGQVRGVPGTGCGDRPRAYADTPVATAPSPRAATPRSASRAPGPPTTRLRRTSR